MIAEQGSATAGITFTAVGFSGGTVAYEDGATEARVAALRSRFNAMGLIALPLASVQGYLGYVPFDGVEVRAHGGLQELGPEVRVGLTGQGEPGEIATALAVGGYYRPLARGWAGRAGVDVSRRFEVLSPLANLYVSFGRESHALFSAAHDQRSCDSFGGGGCGEGEAGAAFATRDELRLTAALGLGITIREETAFDGFRSYYEDRVTLIPAISPFLTLWDSGYRDVECPLCQTAMTDLGGDYGLHVMFGVQAR